MARYQCPADDHYDYNTAADPAPHNYVNHFNYHATYNNQHHLLADDD
ncbi:MAG: hypothetical protein HKO10_06445, partial [Acidimicrobiia bacterium]|nr:hypothetical protein [Acidimicrobiia bacterium]